MTKVNRDELNRIIGDYIKDYINKTQDSNLSPNLTGNIPIVWFGNLEIYDISKVKVLTVALNPSDREFSDKRFNENINLLSHNGEVNNELKQTLNQYFDENPYKWFESGFELALNILETSYFPNNKVPNHALHIDACSAIATSKKWTKLSPKIQRKIQNTELFKSLLDCLKPNIIICCCDQKTFSQIFKHDRFKYENEEDNVEWLWEYEYTYQSGRYEKNFLKSKNTNRLQYIRVFRNKSNIRKILVWGKTRNIPFGGFRRKDDVDFERIFKEIIQRF